MSKPFPPEKQALRAMTIAYPDSDPEVRANLAYLVSARRHSIGDALAMLEEKEKAAKLQTQTSTPAPAPARVAPVGGATTAAARVTTTRPTVQTTTSPQPRTQPSAQPSTGSRPVPSATTNPRRTQPPVTSAKSAMGGGVSAESTSPNHRVIHEQRQSKLIHYFYGDNADHYEADVLREPGQVILFTTSMTGDRRVRDHCRALETLLAIKQIPHHVMDVADNAYLQRKVRQLCRKGTGHDEVPLMPVLCVDEEWIGGYENIQDLEDEGLLDARLLKAGCSEDILFTKQFDYYGSPVSGGGGGGAGSGVAKFEDDDDDAMEDPKTAEHSQQGGTVKPPLVPATTATTTTTTTSVNPPAEREVVEQRRLSEPRTSGAVAPRAVAVPPPATAKDIIPLSNQIRNNNASNSAFDDDPPIISVSGAGRRMTRQNNNNSNSTDRNSVNNNSSSKNTSGAHIIDSFGDHKNNSDAIHKNNKKVLINTEEASCNASLPVSPEPVHTCQTREVYRNISQFRRAFTGESRFQLASDADGEEEFSSSRKGRHDGKSTGSKTVSTRNSPLIK